MDPGLRRDDETGTDGRTSMTILADKVVLVTGAGAGIGRAIALMMAGNGAIVAAADIDPTAAHLTAADCTQEGAAVENRRAIAIEADCSMKKTAAAAASSTSPRSAAAAMPAP